MQVSALKVDPVTPGLGTGGQGGDKSIPVSDKHLQGLGDCPGLLQLSCSREAARKAVCLALASPATTATACPSRGANPLLAHHTPLPDGHEGKRCPGGDGLSRETSSSPERQGHCHCSIHIPENPTSLAPPPLWTGRLCPQELCNQNTSRTADKGVQEGGRGTAAAGCWLARRVHRRGEEVSGGVQ